MLFLRLLALAAFPVALLSAESSPADARIARVESGLLPAARIAGAAAEPWTLVKRSLVHRVPGISVAVIADGRLSWARGYGLARVGDSTPVTPDTLFQAAALSQPVAAAALLSLVDSGQLSLDADLAPALVSWKLPASPDASAPVTLRRLLSHTAGFNLPAAEGYAAGTAVPTLLEVLAGAPPARSPAVRLEGIPGAKWRFSSGGYAVAQQLSEDVARTPFPAFAAARTLTPAGMTSSTFAPSLPAELAGRAAAGHVAGSTRLPGDAHIYPELAAAGLWTTASDVARFLLALSAALEGKPSCLSRATAAAMITPPLPDSAYGLGIGVLGAGDQLQLAHTGSSEGFRTSFVYYPRLGRGAVILTNSDQGGALIPEVLRALAHEYAWPDYRMIEKTALPLTDSAVSAFSGRYERENVPVLVFRLNGHFYIRIGDRPRIELFPQSDHEFFTLESPDIWSFERGPTGLASHIVLRSSPPQLYRRLNPPSANPFLVNPPPARKGPSL